MHWLRRDKREGVVLWFLVLALAFGWANDCRASDADLAERVIELRIQGKNKEAVETVDAVRAVDRGQVRALVQKAAALEDLGRLREAEQTYQEVLNLDPGNAAARRNLDQLRSYVAVNGQVNTRNASADILRSKGLAALNRKDFDSALQVFHLLRGLCPQDPMPAFYSALCREKQGRTNEAIDAYKGVMEQFPGFAPARVNMVILLLESGQKDAAIRELKEALKVLPGDKRIRYLATVAGISSPNSAVTDAGSRSATTQRP